MKGSELDRRAGPGSELDARRRGRLRGTARWRRFRKKRYLWRLSADRAGKKLTVAGQAHCLDCGRRRLAFQGGAQFGANTALRSVAFDGGVEKDVDSTGLMFFVAVAVTLFSF